MSTPITKQHLKIIDEIRVCDRCMRFDITDAQAAQLIADSEARACDQLRAEVERLKKQIKDDNRSYGCELRDPYGTIWEQATKDHDRAGKAERALAELREWQAGVIANERLHHAERKQAIARAERAEAELHALRLVCGTTDADKFSTWVDRANARAEKAEAELATAKAIIASIEEDGTEEHNAAVRLRQELATERARLDYVMRVCHATNREAIDAAMKEGSA